jgi:hypothetical protein
MDQTPDPFGEDSSGGMTPEQARIERLQAFADALKEKRKKAIEGRAASGIEQEWQEDEEYYDGIDDANRADVQLKGATPSSPVFTTAKPATKATKSNVFMNITQTYVDMAAASVADMLLPTDDMPFGILPRPEPDIEAAVDDPTVMQGPAGQQMAAGDIAKKMLEEAQASADKAQTQVWDWLTQSQWHAEGRALINATAKIGTGCLKGPVPVKKKSKKIDRDQKGTVKLTMVERIVPTSKAIDVRNLYPDPACGENIHSGSYIWEYDTITARGLRDLKGMIDKDGLPIYIDSQIDFVLEEGPNKKYSDSVTPIKRNTADAEKEEFDIWYFTGTASAEDMEAAGCRCQPGAAIPVVVTMVNDRVIKASISTLDSGAFPYDVLRWQKVAGRWAGKGEARKIRTPQRILNGAVRALMDNAGLSSGPQIIIDAESLEPADGNWEITPRKVWKKKAGSPIPNVKDAITSVVIDSVEAELSNIIKFALEMADKCATMPIQQQGQQGVTQETAEGRRLLQNNASVQKRAMAKAFDDDITEPHITRYYEWLLLYGDDPEAKREFVIDARGSSALFERDAQNMAVAAVGALVKDPDFDIDPKRWIAEYFKSNKLDPKRFQYTEAESKQNAQDRAKQPQPQDPKIAAATITAKAGIQKAQMDGQAAEAELQQKQQIAKDELAAQQQADHVQREHEREMKSMDYGIKLMEYAQQRGIGLDEAKVQLTKTAMELRTQKELSQPAPALQQPGGRQRNRGPKPAPQVAPAAVEPPGRAPAGQAFQK